MLRNFFSLIFKLSLMKGIKSEIEMKGLESYLPTRNTCRPSTSANLTPVSTFLKLSAREGRCYLALQPTDTYILYALGIVCKATTFSGKNQVG